MGRRDTGRRRNPKEIGLQRCTADIGTQPLLYILVGTSLLGAVVTWLFRAETTGVNPNRLDNRERIAQSRV